MARPAVFFLNICTVTVRVRVTQLREHLLLTRDPLVEYDIRGRVCSILQGRSTDPEEKQKSRRHRTGCGNMLLRWQSIGRI